MKEFFNSWRKYTGTIDNKQQLGEGWSRWDTAAERSGRAREKRAEKSAAAAADAASPEGIKKAKRVAIMSRLTPIARSLEQDQWDIDYLQRLPYMIAHKFSENPGTPVPDSAEFASFLEAAELALRDAYAKWSSEGKQQYINDTERTWWNSQGHKEYVEEPAENLLASFIAGFV